MSRDPAPVDATKRMQRHASALAEYLRKDPLQDRALWALWREIRDQFSVWRALVSWFAPLHPRIHRNRLLGFDSLEGLRVRTAIRGLFGRLETVSDGDLRALIGLAELNSVQQQFYFNSIVLIYVTVPLAVAAIWAQLFPASLKAEILAPNLQIWATLLIPLLAATAIRFLASWRARAFLLVLQIAEIERSARHQG